MEVLPTFFCFSACENLYPFICFQSEKYSPFGLPCIVHHSPGDDTFEFASNHLKHSVGRDYPIEKVFH